MLGGVYAAECLWWLPASTSAIHAPWLRRVTLVPSARSFRILERALVGVNPVPPLGESFLLADPPFVADAESVRLDGEPRFVPWSELAADDQSGPVRRLDDRLADKGFSKRYRTRWCGQLRAWSGLSPDDRRSELERMLESRHNLRTARDQARRVRAAVHTVRMMGSMQWAFIAVGLPVLALLGRLDSVALPVFAILLFLHVALVWMAADTHREIHGEPPGAGEVALLAISPLHTLRIAEHLSRDALLDHDLHAVLLAVGAPEAFLTPTRATFRALSEPSATASPAVEWWRQTRLRALTRLMREARVHPSHFDLATREDEGARSFCPECRTLYTHDSGFCQDCEGVALKRLTSQQILDAKRVVTRIQERIGEERER